MSSTNDVNVAPGESAEAKRERRRERARGSRTSETAEQRVEQFSRRSIRDRARLAAQSVEQRQTLLQLRRENLDTESAEEGLETGIGMQPSQSNREKHFNLG